MSELLAYFDNNKSRQINKWSHYFSVYERHFNRFRNKSIVVLEIGVFHGGSLQMWKSYFGPQAKIYGLDINPECKSFEEENITIHIGSQADRQFLRDLKNKIPPIDILIDDGGHTMLQQIVTFQELFDHVKPDGIYLCEDLHTSYQIEYGGGYKRRGTFIEFSKNLIDELNAYHSEQSGLSVSKFTTSANSLHFYDSILVIEKELRNQPQEISNGKPTIDVDKSKLMQKTTLWKLKYSALFCLNTILRFLKMRGIKWY